MVAREKGGTAASAPLSLTVKLNDVNDNAPILPSIPAISVQAGEARREVATVVTPRIYQKYLKITDIFYRSKLSIMTKEITQL